MRSTANDYYFVAAFGLDGEHIGTGEMTFASLSEHWLGVCRSLVEGYGPVFDINLQGTLSHVRLKCTSAEGAALVDIYMRGHLASSAAVVTGDSPIAEEQVLGMFRRSLENATSRYFTDQRAPSFDFTAISERPLLIVVPWPNEAVSAQDHEIAKELQWHFAGSLMCGERQA